MQRAAAATATTRQRKSSREGENLLPLGAPRVCFFGKREYKIKEETARRRKTRSRGRDREKNNKTKPGRRPRGPERAESRKRGAAGAAGAAPSHRERTPRSRSARRGRVGAIPEPRAPRVGSRGGGSASGRTSDGPKGGSRRDRALLGRPLLERRAGGNEGPWARRPRRVRGGTTAPDGTWSTAARCGRAAPAARVSCLAALRKEEKVFRAGRKWLCFVGFKEGAGEEGGS